TCFLGAKTVDEEKWAQEQARKIVDTKHSRQVDREAFILRERIKREQGPHLWLELRGAVERKAKMVNSALGQQTLIFSSLDMRTVSIDGKIVAEFDSQAIKFRCMFGSTCDFFSVAVNDSGEVHLFSTSQGNKTVDQIATNLVEGC